MKSTGITRRIDELGRVVIPKEIRKNLKIKDGEMLEIYTLNDQIILKKYSNMDELTEVFEKYVDLVNKITGNYLFITDKNKIISCSEVKKEKYLDKDISNNLEDLLDFRESSEGKKIELIDNEQEKSNYYITPLIVNSDVSGLLILLSNRDIDEKTKMLIDIINKILIEYME